MKQLSGLGRTLSFKYPTNKAIIIITLLAFAVFTIDRLIAGSSLGDSIISAFGLALSIFFAWALARELDPDNNWSAFIAVFLALTFALLGTAPSLLGLFFLMFFVRMTSHITGLLPTFPDLLLFLATSAFLVFGGEWFYGLFAAISLYATYYFDENREKGFTLALTAATIFAILIFISDNYPHEFGEYGYFFALTCTLPLLLIIFSLKCKRVYAKVDTGKEMLSENRLFFARLFTALIGLSSAIWQGNESFKELSALWAAISGIVIWQVFTFIKGFPSRKKNSK